MAKPAPPETHYGTYSKDGGPPRVAPSLDHAIKLEFDGYTKIGDPTDGLTGTTTPVYAEAKSKPTGTPPPAAAPPA